MYIHTQRAKEIESDEIENKQMTYTFTITITINHKLLRSFFLQMTTNNIMYAYILIILYIFHFVQIS